MSIASCDDGVAGVSAANADRGRFRGELEADAILSRRQCRGLHRIPLLEMASPSLMNDESDESVLRQRASSSRTAAGSRQLLGPKSPYPEKRAPAEGTYCGQYMYMYM